MANNNAAWFIFMQTILVQRISWLQLCEGFTDRIPTKLVFNGQTFWFDHCQEIYLNYATVRRFIYLFIYIHTSQIKLYFLRICRILETWKINPLVIPCYPVFYGAMVIFFFYFQFSHQQQQWPHSHLHQPKLLYHSLMKQKISHAG